MFIVALGGLLALLPAFDASWTERRCGLTVDLIENELKIEAAENQTANNKNSSGHPVWQSPFLIDGNSKAETNASRREADQRDAEKKSQYILNRRDLCAQQAMAAWTRAIGVFTLLGLGVLFITFEATRDAVIETRRIGEAQTQAFVSVDKIDIRLYIDEYDGIFRLRLNAANHGATPAFNLRYEISGTIYFKGMQIEIEQITYPSNFKAISAGQVVIDPKRLLGIPDDKAFWARAGKMKSYGSVWLNVRCIHETVFRNRDYIGPIESFSFSPSKKRGLFKKWNGDRIYRDGN